MFLTKKELLQLQIDVVCILCRWTADTLSNEEKVFVTRKFIFPAFKKVEKYQYILKTDVSGRRFITWQTIIECMESPKKSSNSRLPF